MWAVGLEADLPLLRASLAELSQRAHKLSGHREAAPNVGRGTPPVPDAQMRRLKQAVEQSTGLITGMMDKVRGGLLSVCTAEGGAKA